MSDHEHAAPDAGPGRAVHYHHLTVQPITPPEPLVVCAPNFVTALAKVERDIAHLEIVDDATLQAAAGLQVRITEAGKQLEATKAKLKAPFLAKAKEIEAVAKAPAERIDAMKASVSKKLVAYRLKQQEAAAEAERARRAELERLEKLRNAEIEAEAKRTRELAAEVERQRKAQAAADEAARVAGLPPVMEVDFGDDDDEPAPTPPPPEKSTLEKQIEAVKYAPAVAAAKPAGVRYVTRLIHTVTNLSELPDQFVIRTAKDAAIRATFCNGWKDGEPLPACPGVNFKIQRDAVSTGGVADF